jgi:hypothetical protein
MTERRARSVRRVLAVVALGAAALLRPLAGPATAEPGDGVCERTWALPVSGSWHEPANWLPAGVPAADEDACIVAPGAYTVTVAGGPATAATLTIGLLLGTEGPALAVDGQPLALAGTGQVHPGSTIVLSGTATLDTGGLLTNDGTLRAAAGTGGARSLRGPVANAGALDVAGPLTYGGGSDLTNTGTIAVATGASLCVCRSTDGTPGLVNSTGAVAGPGAVTVAAARMTQGTGAVTGVQVGLRASTLTFTGDGAAGFLAEAGTTTVLGDVAEHQVITAVAGTATGNVNLVLPEDTTNAGTILLRSLDAARRASLVVGGGTAPATLTNVGSLRTVAGASPGHRVVGPVVNTGSIGVSADTVLGGTLTNRGALTVGPGATFTVGAAARIVNATAVSVAPNGRLVVASGGDWEQGAGTVTGNVTLATGSDVAFTGTGAGQFIAEGAGGISGDLATGQSLFVAPGASRGTDGAMTNAGTLTLLAGATNAASLSLPTGAALRNVGTLRTLSTGGAPPAPRIAGPVQNDGTLDVRHPLVVEGSLGNDGTVTVASTAALTTGPFRQGTTGVLEVAVSGATTFGRVTTGDADLAGTLRGLVTYDPPAQAAFAVLTHAGRTGTFTTTDVGTSGFTARYDPTAVALVSPDRPPTATAGADRSVSSGASFSLDGRTSSDPEGQPLTYRWETTSAAVIRDPDAAVTTVDGVTGPATLTFRLTVTDGAGGSDDDEIVVTVLRPK